MNRILLAVIIVVIVVSVTATVFFGMAFFVVSLLSNQFPDQSDGRPDRPFFLEGETFENIKTIKSKECLDLVEVINTMNPGAQQVDLYKIWLEDCIEPDPAVPSLP